MIPRHCREVSVKSVLFPITTQNIVPAIAGKSAYVNTNYIVLNNGPDWAVVRVRKAREQGLFQKIDALDIISMPADTMYLEKPEVDVQNASVMVSLAEDLETDSL
ncbi:MAG: hypothetical protein M1305_02960, partial [Candidatus Marsarchaeota archaeon]|nr:hypothetical protein [Candidatus Marsarchaeota archaeon]